MHRGGLRGVVRDVAGERFSGRLGGVLLRFIGCLALGLGCVADVHPLTGPCDGLGEPPDCVLPANGCMPRARVDAMCDELGPAWRCPSPSERPRAPPPVAGAVCGLPEGVTTVGPAIPAGGGCGLLVDADVVGSLSSGPRLWGPADPALRPCPNGRLREVPVRRGAVEGPAFPEVGSIARLGGTTWAATRHVIRDPAMAFQVRITGASVVAMEPGPVIPFDPPRVPTPGYRTLLAEPPWLWQFDCFGLPERLIERCAVARIDPGSASFEPAYLRTDGRLTPGPPTADDPADVEVVFEAGPQHDVVYHPGLGVFLMVSVAGFGDTVFGRVAERPEGPWGPPVDLHRCDLPPAPDDLAPGELAPFCDTARILVHLHDPRRPLLALLVYRTAGRSSTGPKAVWTSLAGLGAPPTPRSPR